MFSWIGWVMDNGDVFFHVQVGLRMLEGGYSLECEMCKCGNVM
jgi:hypothetical protein